MALAALVVASVACGGSDTQDAEVDATPVSVTEPSATVATSGDPPDPSTPASASDTAPRPSTTVQSPEDEPAPSVPDKPGKELEPPTSSTRPDDEPEVSTPDSGELDVSELLAAAGEASVGQSVRGESTVGMSSGPEAVLARATFETDADGNTAMTFSFFGSVSMDFRFVDGTAYVQLPPEFRSSLGLDTTVPDAWLTLDEASAAELGIGCVSPLSVLGQTGSNPECDPLGETATLFPEFGEQSVIVGRETLRGVPTTVVRLTLPLGELLAASLESLPDSDDQPGDLELMEDMFPADAHVQIDAWIGDDLRIHRTVVDLGSLMAGFTDAGEGDFEDMPGFLATTDYYDHGADIAVEAPPPELVAGDLADYLDLGSDSF